MNGKNINTSINNQTSAVDVNLKNINLSYGKNHVLKNISLHIQPGEFYSFLGPSGCGKTTLLRLIAGFESAQSGEVLIGGSDVSKLPPWKRELGMVFQSYALWPHMTVYKNVAFGLEERRLAKEEINHRVTKALDLVGLKSLADRRPSQLSGGQQQRVALARTIVIEPKVLLLDEPLSNLDAKLRIQMRLELRQLQKKLSLTTIFVTHDQEEANTTSDRIAVINDGTVQQIGAPVDLYDNPGNMFVAKFLGITNAIKGVIEKDFDKFYFKSLDDNIVIPIGNNNCGCSNIVFRPQNLIIRLLDEKPLPEMVKLIGKVAHMEFLGSIIRYQVLVGDQTLFVDAPHQRGEAAISENAKVALYLSQDQVVQIN